MCNISYYCLRCVYLMCVSVGCGSMYPNWLCIKDVQLMFHIHSNMICLLFLQRQMECSLKLRFLFYLFFILIIYHDITCIVHNVLRLENKTVAEFFFVRSMCYQVKANLFSRACLLERQKEETPSLNSPTCPGVCYCKTCQRASPSRLVAFCWVKGVWLAH